MVFKKIRKAFSEGSNDSGQDYSDEYLEIDLEQEKKEKKVQVKLFAVKEYEDVTPILNALREGYTIAVINVKPLRQKDSIELKRAISKIKKTVEALQGDIKGFGKEQPDIVIASPSFAEVSKGDTAKPSKTDKTQQSQQGDDEHLDLTS